MVAKRDYRAEEARRNKLARDRGFRSRAEERKFGRHIKNRDVLSRLPKNANEQRTRSLRALSVMRENPRLSIADAARMEGTTSKSMVWHVREGLERVDGRWRAKKGDRLLRTMFVNSEGRIVQVDVRGSKKASEISRYHMAVRWFLDTGDDSLLQPFTNRKVDGVVYETDLEALEDMARRGQLDIESIYEAVV
jgi:hypothetical protein